MARNSNFFFFLKFLLYCYLMRMFNGEGVRLNSNQLLTTC